MKDFLLNGLRWAAWGFLGCLLVLGGGMALVVAIVLICTVLWQIMGGWSLLIDAALAVGLFCGAIGLFEHLDQNNLTLAELWHKSRRKKNA